MAKRKFSDDHFIAFRSCWDRIQYSALAGVKDKTAGKERVEARPFVGRGNPPKMYDIKFTIETDGKTVKKGKKVYKRIKVLILEPNARSSGEGLHIAQGGGAFLDYIEERIGALHENPRSSYTNRMGGSNVRYPASFLIEWVE